MLPAAGSQRWIQHGERVLLWVTWSCFGASFVLDGILAFVMSSEHLKKRLRSDAGIAFGVTTSLASACTSLGMVWARRAAYGRTVTVVAWALFAEACVLNGVLLVLLVRDMSLW